MRNQGLILSLRAHIDTTQQLRVIQTLLLLRQYVLSITLWPTSTSSTYLLLLLNKYDILVFTSSYFGIFVMFW